MRKLLLIFTSLLLSSILNGCAANAYVSPRAYVELMPLERFCQTYSFDYSYQPFYEDIVLEGKKGLIRLKEGYKYAFVNGQAIDMGRAVEYKDGHILVPSSLLSSFSKLKSKDPQLPKLPKLPLKKRRAGHALRRIVIDAGHGGKDPGAISKFGTKEKSINLSVAKYLQKELKNNGYRVYMTRSRDEFLSLQQRVQFTKDKRADLFISIHANAIATQKVRGFEVYYAAAKYSSQQAKNLARSEQLGDIANLKNASYDLKRMVGEYMAKENRKATLEFSSLIMKAAQRTGIKTRKTSGAPFYVLKHNICPAVLIELGYLTNPSEERLLKSNVYQKQLAATLAYSVRNLDKYMAKTSARRYVSRR